MPRLKLFMCVVMTLVFCVMTLGYAALQQRIDVEVEASIDSTYRVEITRVQEGIIVGDARSTQVPSYHDLTSTFNVGLTNDTDYITYTIEITNYSTVDIRLNNTEINVDGSDNIRAAKIGMRNGDIMLAGSTKIVTLKVTYTGVQQATEQTGAINLNFIFSRLKGGTGEVVEEGLPYDYTELEYIESTGRQYIDTKEYFSYDTKISIDVQAKNNTNNIFGLYRKGYWTTGLRIRNNVYEALWLHHINYNGTMAVEFLTSNISYDMKVNIVLDNTGMQIDETFITSTKSIYFDAIETGITLFGAVEINGSDSPVISASRIFSVKIYKNNVLVKNLIPVLDNNDVPCMYDTVTGETFYNQGTGTFLYQLKE